MWPPGKKIRPSSCCYRHIDIHRFSGYCWSLMIAKAESLTRILQVIADPTRRRILEALKQKTSTSAKEHGLCASDIESRIHLSQPTISHHMAILEKAGLIQSRKEQQWRWYRRNEAAIRDFTRALKKAL
jgi:DNA-binding transcriptional ArsR family regulator